MKISSGVRFGRLITIKQISGRPTYRWLCICDCGIKKAILRSSLIGGLTKSCGCLRREATSTRNTVHGLSKIPEYKIWKEMKRRCFNAARPGYQNYGGRGIKVCSRWNDSFPAFLKDVGRRPSKNHWLDRIANDLGYRPGNVKWSTEEESRNNKQQSVWISLNGLKRTMLDWSKIIGIKYTTLRARKRRGWNDRRILLEEVRTSSRRKDV